MKKLIIAAVVFAAVAAHAMGSWSIASMKDISGSAYSGSVNIYCYDGGWLYASGAGEVVNGSMGSTPVDLGTLLIDSDYTFYYTATDARGNTFVSEQVTQTIWSGDDAIAFSGSGTWTAVPEPTGGLLLLVGMAGLALKRKRA